MPKTVPLEMAKKLKEAGLRWEPKMVGLFPDRRYGNPLSKNYYRLWRRDFYGGGKTGRIDVMYLIAFEGIDCSGKETQAEMLCKELVTRGHTASLVTFPRYHKPIGNLIKKWLNGEVSISDEAAHMLYEADRVDFMQELTRLYESDVKFLILDRYLMSNIAFCMAKGIDIQWVKNMQEKIVKPDVTFIMDVTMETSIKRKPDGRDKHELNNYLLNRARAAYHHLASQGVADGLAYIIDANCATPEDIHESVMSHVELLFLTQPVE